MNKPIDVETDKRGTTQRKNLEQAEERASAKQPESYKKNETAEKIVEIGSDKTAAPIKGIDPPSKS